MLVVDKPHFLPFIPVGRFLYETLLVRLKKKSGLTDLTSIHRLDHETAGVVIFSFDIGTWGAYQSLLKRRLVDKVYMRHWHHHAGLTFSAGAFQPDGGGYTIFFGCRK